MNKLFFFFACILLSLQVKGQAVYHDSTALVILDKVSEYIGELNSLKFRATIEEDVAFSDNYLIKEFRTAEFVFQGGSQMASKITQQGKDNFYFYNGNQVVYYNLEGNYYAAGDAPDNTLDMLDWLNESFGVHLVLADFLYPNFTSNLMESMDYIEFLGTAIIGKEKTFHIGGANKDLTFQIWISQDLQKRPIKALITYLGAPYARQLEVTFDKWEINQEYPSSMFEFLPGPNSKQIIWTKKN
ncbi:MAG: DUF2092 domain-containing protein [Algoriphagus sp.]|uniref:DUF2092 domain-containing protein n=1 Tax=Algoriphagus sp. TaxID=1872435 RepID=UPI00181BB853|nr:DUF2092 domain-containing protein [Algoriphagus sp.]NVJ87703.1 DUF2092 domain-containing protein [Algoriphagus sp.]